MRPRVRSAARTVLAWAVRGRQEQGTVWGEAVLGEFEETSGAWEAVRWTASGLRVALRARLIGLFATRSRRLVAAVALAIVAAFAVNWLAVGLAYIPSTSMEPTLRAGDRILTDKITYRWTGLHRGDVVVFSLPADRRYATFANGEPIRFIKRVVGLPGDSITCRDGRVYRDGVPLAEPYEPAGSRTECAQVTVPAGSLYVLGDDRTISRDSRDFGTVPIHDVSARLVTRIGPLSGPPG